MQRPMFILLLCCCVVNVFGQLRQPVSTPAKDLIEKLNAGLFSQAEIVLVNEGVESDLEITKVPYQKLQFNKGFSVAHFNGCNLTLRNEASLIRYAFLSADNQIGYGKVTEFFSDLHLKQKPSDLEIVIPVHDLSHKKGKHPHLLSNNPKKTNSYGKWGVQLKTKGGSIRAIATDNNGRIEKIDGHILTFVFDNETSSRQFDSDFRKAIRICNMFDPPSGGPTIKLPPVVIVN